MIIKIFIIPLLLESLVRNHGRLNQTDFLTQLEEVILRGDPTMDGTRTGGRFGWTDKSICDLYRGRILEGKAWEDCVPSRSDTPDAIVRSALLGALYYRTPREMAVQVRLHARYATGDSSVQAHSVAFASMIAALLDHPNNLALDEGLSTALYNQAGLALPFSSLHSSSDVDPSYGIYTEPDSLLWFGQIAKGLHANPALMALPKQSAQQGVLLYGQFCAFFATLPSAYYCAARFPNHFEDAILCSVNGVGQNTMRSSLVGALLGARVGLSGIPPRFVDGLEDSQYILELAHAVADAAIARTNTSDAWNWPDTTDHLNGLPAGRISPQENKESTKLVESFMISASSKMPTVLSNDTAANQGPICLAFALGVILALLINKGRWCHRSPSASQYDPID